MHVVLEKGDPLAYREELIALFERNGDPGVFRKAFDWSFRDGGLGTPTSWFLRAHEKDRLVGFCSVVFRRFRWQGIRFKVGMVGNLLLDGEARKTLGALSLVRAAQSLVHRKEVDILLAVPKRNMNSLLSRMGFSDLGALGMHTEIFRSRNLLRSRLGRPGALFSPLVNAWAASRRLLFAPSSTSGSEFRPVEMSKDNLQHVPIESWSVPDGRIVGEPSAVFLRRRFLETPLRQYHVLGLADVRSKNEICGFVVVTYDSGKVLVWDCRTDARRLGEAQAILEVCRHWRHKSDVFSVPALRSSHLARELQAVGFARLPTLPGTAQWCVLGFWRRTHTLAQQFAQSSEWNLFGGFAGV